MEEDCDRCAMFEEARSQKSSLSGEKGHREQEFSERGSHYKFCVSVNSSELRWSCKSSVTPVCIVLCFRCSCSGRTCVLEHVSTPSVPPLHFTLIILICKYS